MAKTVEANAPRKARSQMGEVWHQFRRNKGAMVGSAIVLIIVFVALFADVFLDYDTQVVGQNVAERLQWPSARHWFGTDELGRDIFSAYFMERDFHAPWGWWLLPLVW